MEMFSARQQDYVRPYLGEVSSFVGKRWNFGVIWELRNNKKMRFNQLLSSLAGISPSTLSSTLKSLEKSGLITRTRYGKTPPFKVEYSITKKGIELIVASSPLIKWVMKKRIFHI
ncbi:MAG TPA: helix-turn-helix domain-containing protein [Candidatus Nitrosotenuis sp.]|jgi:DNA-binding HxlR family transcriptional regulator